MPLSTARSALALPYLLLLLALVGCGGDEPASTDTDATYTVRGVVRQLPDASVPGTSFTVHHEPVPDFVDSSGETVGMDAMAMPFPVADDDLLEGVEVGDRVRMTFEVDWDGSPPMQVVELEELPADTALEFETGVVTRLDFESGSLDDSEVQRGGAGESEAGAAEPGG